MASNQTTEESEEELSFEDYEDFSEDYPSTNTQSEGSFQSNSVSLSMADFQRHLQVQHFRSDFMNCGRSSSWSHRMSLSFSVLSILTDEDRPTSTLRSRVDLFSLPSSRMKSPSLLKVPLLNPHPKRSWLQLVMLCMFQFGMEFMFAVETVLVTPTLLKLGLPTMFYSIMWLGSPILGIIFTPLIGWWSDNCHLRWGKRRPFILFSYIIMVTGQALLLNGGDIGMILGDGLDQHTVGLVLTLLGTMMVDFSISFGVVPARAYIVDVCNFEDAQVAFILRSFLGGLGGGIGYLIIGFNLEETPLQAIGHQNRIIFITNTLVCSISFLITLISIAENPLGETKQTSDEKRPQLIDRKLNLSPDLCDNTNYTDSRTWGSGQASIQSGSSRQDNMFTNKYRRLSLTDYKIPEGESMVINQDKQTSSLEPFKAIWKIPRELVILCFNQFMGWFSFLCVVLFYTDYMGQTVYKGDPNAPKSSLARELYDEGIKMGSWGLCIFQFMCALAAIIFSKLSLYIDLRATYVFGQLIFAVATGAMILVTDSVIGTLLLFSTFGLQFFILLTLPTVLVALYHQNDSYVTGPNGQRRGLGVDIACIGVQAFLGQVLVSTIVGPLINYFESHLVIIILSSSVAFCSTIFTALFVVFEISRGKKGPLK